MATTARSLTLAERAHAVAFPEPILGGISEPVVVLHQIADALEKSDLAAEWGLVLGITIAIARTEDPFAPLEHVLDRALPAAAEAFKRYTLIDVLEAVA